MPEATPARHRKGSPEWRTREWTRLMDLSKQHDGMTTAFFVAIALGVSRQRVYQMVDQGLLHPVEIMGKLLFPGDEVFAYAASDRTPGRHRLLAA